MDDLIKRLQEYKRCVGFKSAPSEDGGHMVCSAQYGPHPLTTEAATALAEARAEIDRLHDQVGDWIVRADEAHARADRLEWQPIETAPKDGSLFLGLCGRTVSTWWIVERAEKKKAVTTGIWPFRKTVETFEQEAGLYLENVTDGGGIFYVGAGRRLGLNPTHWVPLPEPPVKDDPPSPSP